MSYEEVEQFVRAKLGTLPCRRVNWANDGLTLVQMLNYDKNNFPENYYRLPANWTRARLATVLATMDEQLLCYRESDGLIIGWMGNRQEGNNVDSLWTVVRPGTSAQTHRILMSMYTAWAFYLYRRGVLTVTFDAPAASAVWKQPWFSARREVLGTDPTTGTPLSYRAVLLLRAALGKAYRNLTLGIDPNHPLFQTDIGDPNIDEVAEPPEVR